MRTRGPRGGEAQEGPAAGLLPSVLQGQAAAVGLGDLAAEALAGRDDFCMQYLKAFRGGLFEE